MSPDADSHNCAVNGADSAGVPWAGREFRANPNSDDHGEADPALWDALTASPRDWQRRADVVAALRQARVLVPLLAEAGELGFNQAGQMVDKTQELSIVKVAAPDGRVVLPVFSSVETMKLWNPLARPIPWPGQRTAAAAVSEGTELLVIDPGSAHEFVVRRPALWALANDELWSAPEVADDIFRAFADSLAGELAIINFALRSGDPGASGVGAELEVVLEVSGSVSSEVLDLCLKRLALRWSRSDVIAQGVDSLRVRLLSEDSAAD